LDDEENMAKIETWYGYVHELATNRRVFFRLHLPAGLLNNSDVAGRIKMHNGHFEFYGKGGGPVEEPARTQFCSALMRSTSGVIYEREILVKQHGSTLEFHEAQRFLEAEKEGFDYALLRMLIQ
jgi:hypothetical protein